jgi:hypothetical protein
MTALTFVPSFVLALRQNKHSNGRALQVAVVACILILSEALRQNSNPGSRFFQASQCFT